jgi:CRISPR system Cascade subunit CasC
VTAQADFFTAVDDLGEQWGQEAGSAHMNNAEFSSGVFYRYATIAVHDLLRNLGPDHGTAAELTKAFLHAFISSMPEAKKTSTAPHTIPDLVYVAVRQDRPMSLAAAFEAPVRATGTGWAAPSRDTLATYATTAHRLFGTTGLAHHAHAGVDPKPFDGLGDLANSYDALIDGAVRAGLPAA